MCFVGLLPKSAATILGMLRATTVAKIHRDAIDRGNPFVHVVNPPPKNNSAGEKKVCCDARDRCYAGAGGAVRTRLRQSKEHTIALWQSLPHGDHVVSE